MGKRKRPFSYQGTRRISLESIPDTGGTIGDPVSARIAKRQRSAEFESVEPPFKSPEKKTLFMDWQELSPFIKFGIAIASFFIAIVVPAVWYMSKLDSNVDTLNTDVRDVKQRTDELGRNAIRQDERIGYLEKTVGNAKLDTTRNSQKK
jgi:hypothetical protein